MRLKCTVAAWQAYLQVLYRGERACAQLSHLLCVEVCLEGGDHEHHEEKAADHGCTGGRRARELVDGLAYHGLQSQEEGIRTIHPLSTLVVQWIVVLRFAEAKGRRLIHERRDQKHRRHREQQRQPHVRLEGTGPKPDVDLLLFAG